MARSRAIGHIVKKLNGKRIPKRHRCDRTPRYEFPTQAAACTAVWAIHEETGREASNSGNTVTVWT